MSQQPISRSADLKALRDDGYEVEVKDGHLVIHNVPYVNAKKELRRGTLVSTLNLADDVTRPPDTHVAMFAGEPPCDASGQQLSKIINEIARKEVCKGLFVDLTFSSKPAGGVAYKDYYEKMATYAAILSCHAEALDPSATPRTRRVIESNDPESIFNYIDTASGRAGIAAIARKLELAKIAIVGLGGTGSYILDLIVKTLVREIHLFDGDYFLQHNAFRSPGAASPAQLRRILRKVEYWAEFYAPMRKNVIPHDFHIDAKNADCLQGMDFVFVCVDKGSAKPAILEKLEALGIPFIDVGMGIELVDDRLHGILRVTASTAQKRDHVREKKRIGLVGDDRDDIYSRNIQIAELNSLSASLAVIKWKKLFGFYGDLEREHFSAYTIDGNAMINEDQA